MGLENMIQRRQRRALLMATAASALLLAASPAQASDDAFEFWFNPSVSTDLDDDTGLELETAQRFRSAADGRADTYFARLWVNQAVTRGLTLSGGVERRINDPGADEFRLHQQASFRHGLLRGRFRVQQSFPDGARMGVRVQPRLGFETPVGKDGRWALFSNAELFFTLRSTSSGGQTGLTGLRTQIGASRELSDHVELTVAYLRQQDILDGRPDRVGHAPLIGLEFSF